MIAVGALVIVAALVAADPVRDLEDWFERYRRSAAGRLFHERDLLELGLWSSGRTLRPDVEGFRVAYERHVTGGGVESPENLIRAIRESESIASYRKGDRFRKYADLLGRIDRVVADGRPESVRLLSRIAGHDAARQYSVREWRIAAPLRPHLLRREARGGLMRIPPERAIPGLLAVLALEGMEGEPPSVGEYHVAAPLVARILERSRLSDYLRFQAVQSLLLAALHHPHPTARESAARALKEIFTHSPSLDIGEARASRLVERLDVESDAAVRLALVELCGRVRHPLVVESLARAMAEAPGIDRELHEAYQVALDRVTPVTVDGLSDRGAWLHWYELERYQEDFRRFYRPRGAEAAPDRPPREYAEAPRFWGVPVIGRRVVLVVDISGSMGFAADGTTGGTKMDQARRELVDAIRELDDPVRFRLVFFNTGVLEFPNEFVPANEHNRREAVSFVRRVRASGSTELFGGLARALELSKIGQDLRSLALEERPDQVIVLSDGVADGGPIASRINFADEVARYNFRGSARIDTVAFGADADRFFLEYLALQNGGEMKVVDFAGD